MKTFISTSTTRPKPVLFGKHTVDVNTDVQEVAPDTKRKKGHAGPEENVTLYKYKTTRYTTAEYLKKLTEDNQTTALAVAELADLYAGGR